ncbi:MAG: MarR family transcriptional regulator, partial [Caldilineaceae bacterium]|nr:MarR family transcriptional regulator [Caldilineaceae bacterium]
TTFSSNDPLFNDNYHPVDSFNAMQIWEHDGDFLAALDSAALDVGMFTTRQERALVDALKDYILTNDIGQHIPEEKRTRHKNGGTVYRTRNTDVRILSQILDIMYMAGRIADVRVNAYQVVRGIDSHGQRVETHSHKTVAPVLQRHGWLFSVEDSDKANTWHLSLRVDVSTFPLNIKELLITLGGKVETSTFDHWKNDDVYGSGTSGVVRSALRAEALAERDPGENDGAVTDRYRAKLAELTPGLQAMAIPIIEAITNAGGSGITTPELAEAFGLTASSVNGTLRKLRNMGLIESHRQYKAPSIHFATGELFAEIDERRHEFRTYNAGVNRLAKSLEKAAARTENQIGFTRAGGGDTTALEDRQRNITRQWREALGALHPDWDHREIHEWMWAEKPTATPYLDRREIERAAAERAAERRYAEQAIRAAIADFTSQGIGRTEAARMLEYTDYSDHEKRMILSMV